MQTLPEDFIENKIKNDFKYKKKLNRLIHSIADFIFGQVDSHQATLCHMFQSEYTPAFILFTTMIFIWAIQGRKITTYYLKTISHLLNSHLKTYHLGVLEKENTELKKGANVKYLE